MNTPIFIDNKGDMSVFSSVQDAEAWVEAIDVENGEYKAFDAEGRLLRLTTENEAVRIAQVENEPSHAGEFREKLHAFLKAAKVPNVDPGASLSQLVNAASQFTIKTGTPGGFLRRMFGRSK